MPHVGRLRDCPVPGTSGRGHLRASSCAVAATIGRIASGVPRAGNVLHGDDSTVPRLCCWHDGAGLLCSGADAVRVRLSRAFDVIAAAVCNGTRECFAAVVAVRQ